MPGALPPTSGCTYTADYSLDDATAAGATRVIFDRPVITLWRTSCISKLAELAGD